MFNAERREGVPYSHQRVWYYLSQGFRLTTLSKKQPNIYTVFFKNMKQLVDKYKEDIALNNRWPIFTPFDDKILGKRGNGFFKKVGFKNNFFCEDIIFDNGHRYVYFPETEMLYEGEPVPKDFFIHKYIEKSIYEIVVCNSDDKSPSIYCDPYEVEVLADTNPLLVFRAVIDREIKVVSVTNILVYKRHLGYGKKLLKSIYTACKNLGYRLFLTEMVLPFYKSMVERGANVIKFNDVVEITDKTHLE